MDRSRTDFHLDCRKEFAWVLGWVLGRIFARVLRSKVFSLRFLDGSFEGFLLGFSDGVSEGFGSVSLTGSSMDFHLGSHKISRKDFCSGSWAVLGRIFNGFSEGFRKPPPPPIILGKSNTPAAWHRLRPLGTER